MSQITLDDLISSLRSANAADLEARAAHSNKLADMRSAEVRGEVVLESDVEKLRGEKSKIDAAVALRSARITQLEADKASDAAALAMSAEVRASAPKVAYDQVARTGAEPRTYSRENDRTGQTFIADVAASALGDWQAREKLGRHMVEERMERKGEWQNRATSTGSFVGLTVPQYLTDFYAPNAKANRPFIEAARKLSLPEKGMTVNISRITTGSDANIQASQNSAVTEQNIADTLLTIPVQTVAAQQTMSRQAIERSTGAEDVTMDDMMRQYYTRQDNLFINQATTGLTNRATVVANSTAPSGAQTAASVLYAKILAARAGLESILLDTQEGDQLLVMHARRWAAINSASGTVFPFLSQAPNSRYLSAGEDFVDNYGPGFRGTFAGLNVIVDNNIATNLGGGTNQDEVYVVNRRECIVWEDPSAPVMIRAEQTNAGSLGVLFVMYGYMAYTFDRYQAAGQSAQQKISGTQMIPPVFDGSGA